MYPFRPRNLDHNTGNPLGLSVCQITAQQWEPEDWQGLQICEFVRVTAHGAFLSYDVPKNLTIMGNSPVRKILFKDKKAIGVEVHEGRGIKCTFISLLGTLLTVLDWAREEVILACGTVDTPRLLLMSGVGPETEINKPSKYADCWQTDRTFDSVFLKPLHVIDGVGQNMSDRLFVPLVCRVKEGAHQRTMWLNTPERIAGARLEYEECIHSRWKAGHFISLLMPQALGFFKSEKIVNSKEFKNLPADTQKAWLAETKPHYEVMSVSGSIHPRVMTLKESAHA